MKITLDSIRASIEKKYAAFELEDIGLSLTNPLRLPKDDRAELLAFESQLDEVDDPEEQIALIGQLVTLVAKDKGKARSFLKSLEGDDDADVILLEIVSQYMEAQEVGEASPSES